ncbi:MAG: phosphate signaling complex protein PhoU [Trueperaceae bacterium]
MRPDAMNPLEHDLQAINGDLVRMLSMVREGCALARQALVDQDMMAARRCIDGDDAIDRLQADLEMRILTVIARRQPAARDLRFLGGSLQALADIERAGDYAEHVATAAMALAEQPPLKKYLDLQRIFDVLSAMLDASAKAFAEADEDAARRSHAMDSEIDALYDQIHRELLTYMIQDPTTINRANQLLSVARYLERLGDHLENVDEHILFWLTGERI